MEATTKEQMNKYLEEMQNLQNVCKGHTVKVEIKDFNGKTAINFCAIWEDRFAEKRCKCFSVREWLSKEENDYRMRALVDFLKKEARWI